MKKIVLYTALLSFCVLGSVQASEENWCYDFKGDIVFSDKGSDVDALKKLEKTMDFSKQEGYVIRLKDSFHYDEFGTSVAKFVRANHVQTDQHWRHSAIVPNILKDENEKETCDS